jgi:DNA-binding transcriptional regulator YhcF (GntR family)
MSANRRKSNPSADNGHRHVSQRWTPTIAQAGWTPVSDYFLANYHRLKLSHIEAMVIIHLMQFKWDYSDPYPSLQKIAKRMGITVASVRKHMQTLEAKEMIIRHQRTGTSNRYNLNRLFQHLESLMERDALSNATVEAQAMVVVE